MRKLAFLILLLPLGLRAQSEGLNIDSLLSVRDGLCEIIDSMREQESAAKHERDLWLDSIAMLHNFSHNMDSLKAEIDSALHSEAELRQKYEYSKRAREYAKDEVDKEGNELKAMKASLETYLPAYLKTRSSEFITYTERLYSQMDKRILENYLLEAEEYKGRDEMKEAYCCLEISLARMDSLEACRYLLEIPLDTAVVNKARDYILALESKLIVEQWEEIYNTLDAYLSWYEDGVIEFRKLLVKLESSDDVKAVFDSQKENEDRYYKNIPYLRDRYKWIRNSMINGRIKEKTLNNERYKEIRKEIENITTK